MGVLLDPSTYDGNAVLNLLMGTLGGTAQSLVVAGVMGKVIGGPMGALSTVIGHVHVAARSRPMVPLRTATARSRLVTLTPRPNSAGRTHRSG